MSSPQKNPIYVNPPEDEGQKTAPPVYPQPVYFQAQQIGYQQAPMQQQPQQLQPPQTVYMQYQPYAPVGVQGRPNIVYVEQQVIPEDDYQCALVGLIFSWIPIIGWINCCININGGPRARTFAIWSGVIATIIAIANIVAFSVSRQYYFF